MMDPFEKTPDISVVIPVYNEGANIRPLANEVFDALAGRLHYELIFVDDGSEDDTPDEVERMINQNPVVLLCRHIDVDFSAAAEVHTGWPRTSMTGNLVLQPDGSESLVREVSDRNASRYSEFHSLDIRVSRDVDVARGDLTAFLEVTDLYDRQNPCCIEYSVRPDGSLASRDKHWLTLVPSLGVVWRF